ncbi:hypothetical protein SDC9_136933 [bioreactor metagenome]|uniref:Uncharacterized protein n=1 Tax=bioreactor metagenome TaxID=1076179 RepID=A0A645DL71_9ZZZZ
MRTVIEHHARLVEADVAVHADAQQLHVDGFLGNRFAECRHVCVDITRALGNDGVLLVNVDVVKEVFVHKAAVALRMIRRQPHIFVEVDGVHAGEIKLPRFVCRNEVGIYALRRAARCEAKARIRLVADHVANHFCREFTGFCKVFGYNDVHVSYSFVFFVLYLLIAIPSFKFVFYCLFGVSIVRNDNQFPEEMRNVKIHLLHGRPAAPVRAFRMVAAFIEIPAHTVPRCKAAVPLIKRAQQCGV